MRLDLVWKRGVQVKNREIAVSILLKRDRSWGPNDFNRYLSNSLKFTVSLGNVYSQPSKKQFLFVLRRFEDLSNLITVKPPL